MQSDRFGKGSHYPEVMSGSGWFGTLPLGKHAKSRSGRTEGVQGLVLSGGGSKASFQIGALRYLYEREHIAPRVITATSAGSILGALLAQSSDPAKQLQAVHNVDRLWMSMQTSSDMFAEREWFSRLKTHSGLLDSLRQTDDSQADVEQGEMGPDGESPDSAAKPSGVLGILAHPLRSLAGDPPVNPLPEPPGEDGTENLAPQLVTVAMALAEEPPAPVGWSPGLLYQLFSELPHIGRVGADLTSAWRGLESSRSFYKPGVILQRLLSRDFFHSEDVTTSGMVLRCAFVGLESGELRYMREDGRIVNRDDEPIGGGTFDISMGVLASCSIPGVFRSVEMDDENYVDGGIRENVPVEMAVAHLGVTRPYVIIAGPPRMQAEPGIGSKDLLSVLYRVDSIRANESVRDEIGFAESTGAVVIAPEVLVHDSMTIDPGLLAINRGYGWMRAAEVVRGADAEAVELDKRIILARMEAWRQENKMLMANDEPDDHDPYSPIGIAKDEVRRLVAQADPELLPPGAEDWPKAFEGHPGPSPVK